MKISTINSIETSSLCNQRCQYCPAREQGKHRPTGLMDMDTFDAALSWVSFFAKAGTQRELNLFGVGEPTLNPLLPEMIEKARRTLPLRLPVHINTNGQWIDTKTTAITEDEIAYVRKLKAAGIDHIDLTGHDAFKTAKAIRVFQTVGIPGKLSFDYIVSPNNWAGQCDWFEPTYDAGPCPWIFHGQVMVMSNGDITRCCIDAFGTGVLGNIREGEIDKIDVSPFALCEKCHHTN